MPSKSKRSAKKEPLSREALAMVAARFRAMGDATRLELIQALMEGEKSVQDLSAITEMSQANISKHLSVLLEQGIVSKRKSGLFSLYSVADQTVFDLCDVVCKSIARRHLQVHEEFSGSGI